MFLLDCRFFVFFLQHTCPRLYIFIFIFCLCHCMLITDRATPSVLARAHTHAYTHTGENGYSLPMNSMVRIQVYALLETDGWRCLICTCYAYRLDGSASSAVGKGSIARRRGRTIGFLAFRTEPPRARSTSWPSLYSMIYVPVWELSGACYRGYYFLAVICIEPGSRAARRDAVRNYRKKFYKYAGHRVNTPLRLQRRRHGSIAHVRGKVCGHGNEKRKAACRRPNRILSVKEIKKKKKREEEREDKIYGAVVE